MLVVPLLGFIFLKMGPVVVPISGTPGLAQEMGHPYLIWLDGAPKLEPFQGPKPKPQTHHKNESKGVFFFTPSPGRSRHCAGGPSFGFHFFANGPSCGSYFRDPRVGPGNGAPLFDLVGWGPKAGTIPGTQTQAPNPPQK